MCEILEDLIKNEYPWVNIYKKEATDKHINLDGIPAPDVNLYIITTLAECDYNIIESVFTKYPGSRLLVLGRNIYTYQILSLVQRGASGYISLNTDKKEFVKALRVVLNKNIYFSPDICQDILNTVVKYIQSSDRFFHNLINPLTDRESEVLKLIALGKSSSKIAEMLFISKRTVENHRRNIMRKLNATNTVALVNYAHANNLV